MILQYYGISKPVNNQKTIQSTQLSDPDYNLIQKIPEHQQLKKKKSSSNSTGTDTGIQEDAQKSMSSWLWTVLYDMSLVMLRFDSYT